MIRHERQRDRENSDKIDQQYYKGKSKLFKKEKEVQVLKEKSKTVSSAAQELYSSMMSQIKGKK